MEFANVGTLDKRAASDFLVLPFWNEKKKGAKAATDLGSFEKIVEGPIETGDFSGKEGEISLLYHASSKEKRVLLLGLGDKNEVTVESLRRAYGSLAKSCRKHKAKHVTLALFKSSDLTDEDIVEGISEGILLTNYAFEKHKKERAAVFIEKVTFVGATPATLALANHFATIAEGVYLARDLINGNADDVTPQHLSSVAKDLAKKYKSLKVTILDKKAIVREKLSLIEAVSRGGPHDPALIFLEYAGNPKSKDKTVLVGKGVTFDTGGLNLKPTGSMETMKSDMSGAAAVLGIMKTIAALKMKVNVVGVIPATENAISDRSYKPGDVYPSYAGVTVEIGNTDAEGRLILADALAYAEKKFKPTRMIDFATLTGAMVVALGDESAGLMSTSDALADSLLRAGAGTFERIWRLPLYPEYREQLKSQVADIKNTGGRAAGSITAAFFLKEFVKDTPWAHIDIAGTAYLDKEKRYLPQHATGFGVRLIIEFLKNL